MTMTLSDKGNKEKIENSAPIFSTEDRSLRAGQAQHLTLEALGTQSDKVPDCPDHRFFHVQQDTGNMEDFNNHP